MQKKLIAIAIAAALAPAAAMADTSNINVYGRLNVSLDSQTGVTGQTSGLALNTNSSRFGVKGTEDLGDGYKAIFQVEANVNLTGTGRGGNGNTVANTVTNAQNFGAFGGQIRDTFLGLSTPMGTIQAGRLPMENHWAYDTNLFADQIGDLLIFSCPAPCSGRSNGELLYTTPNLSGFTANVQFYPTSSVNPSAVASYTPGPTAASSHSWGFEANYAVLGVKLNFNYLSKNTGFNTEYRPIVLSGTYDFGQGLVGAQYMRDKRNNAAYQQAERTIFSLNGKYNVMPNGALKASYARANDVTGDAAAGTAVNGLTINSNSGANMFVFGFDYSLSKRTMVQLAYARTKNDGNANFGINGGGHNNQIVTPTNNDSPRAFGVNVAHNF